MSPAQAATNTRKTRIFAFLRWHLPWTKGGAAIRGGESDERHADEVAVGRRNRHRGRRRIAPYCWMRRNEQHGWRSRAGTGWRTAGRIAGCRQLRAAPAGARAADHRKRRDGVAGRVRGGGSAGRVCTSAVWGGGAGHAGGVRLCSTESAGTELGDARVVPAPDISDRARPRARVRSSTRSRSA